MKMKHILFSLAGVAFLSLASCMSEEPFRVESNNNLVKFNVSMNTSVTRAVDNETAQSLLNSCIIYISSKDGGLLHKWNGYNSVPSEGVYLKFGEYVAEAWAGDSVPASFNSKFYKGHTPFEVGNGNVTTQVTIACKLANVVTSLDVSELDANLAKDIKVTFENAGNTLSISDNNIMDKGYFMRPYNYDAGYYESSFNYTVTGKDVDGSPIEKKGILVSNAQPAHEYRLVIKNNPEDDPSDPYGGANLTITVEDYELEADEEAVIYGAPQFAWEGSSKEVTSPITRSGDDFETASLLVGAYGGFNSLSISTEDPEMSTLLGNKNNVEVISITESDLNNLKELGLDFVKSVSGSSIQGYKIIFSSTWLNKLAKRDIPYQLTVTASDKRGQVNSAVIKISNPNSPFGIDMSFFEEDFLAIGAKHVTLKYDIYDMENLKNPILQYREKNREEWINFENKLAITRAGENTVELKGLKSNTVYECRLVDDMIAEGEYSFVSSIVEFKTEEEYILPNASMEEWWQNGKAWYPYNQEEDFWDTGNKGSTTISSTDNLTVSSTVIKHTGEKSACLTSKFVGLAGVIGKHGAASLFTGVFAGTEQTTHGIIDLGREYNGSHPTALRVWVNYRPKTADKGGNDKYIKKGELDKGQIYIALSTEIHRARTYVPSTLITQENLPSTFIAYNQKTFEGDFGADNTLEEVVIPFEYFESAHTQAPRYLIILCAASKYGDYFSGGEGSQMYVDDFELIYE